MRIAREIPAYFEHRSRLACMYYGHSSSSSNARIIIFVLVFVSTRMSTLANLSRGGRPTYTALFSYPH